MPGGRDGSLLVSVCWWTLSALREVLGAGHWYSIILSSHTSQAQYTLQDIANLALYLRLSCLSKRFGWNFSPSYSRSAIPRLGWHGSLCSAGAGQAHPPDRRPQMQSGKHCPSFSDPSALLCSKISPSLGIRRAAEKYHRILEWFGFKGI